MSKPAISHISDTARWVAVYRAWESRQRDALFSDPYAERLAGERGPAIAALMPRQARSGWPLIARTKIIDDLILRAVREGCDRVLGAMVRGGAAVALIAPHGRASTPLGRNDAMPC